MKKKILIIILIVLVALIIILNILVIGNQSQKEKSSLNDERKILINNNSSFREDKEVKGLLFTNVAGEYDGESYIISYTIINQTDDNIHLGELTLIVKDKNGTEITRINYNYNYDLSSGQEYPTSHIINDNILDAYSIEFIANE